MLSFTLGPSGGSVSDSALSLLEEKAPRTRVALLDVVGVAYAWARESELRGFNFEVLQTPTLDEVVAGIRSAKRIGCDVILVYGLQAAWNRRNDAQESVPEALRAQMALGTVDLHFFWSVAGEQGSSPVEMCEEVERLGGVVHALPSSLV